MSRVSAGITSEFQWAFPNQQRSRRAAAFSAVDEDEFIVNIFVPVESRQVLANEVFQVPNGQKNRPGRCPEQELIVLRTLVTNLAREVFGDGRFPASLINDWQNFASRSCSR
jgi:hypothetical protein